MSRCARSIGLVLIALLLSSTQIASAQVRFRFAHTLSSEDPGHLALVEFAKRTAEKTAGAVQIDLFPAGQLGNDPQILDGIKLGTIDMGMAGNPFYSGFAPEMNVLDLPYLFRDYEHAYKVVDGPIGAEVFRAVERSGLKGLGSLEIGFRELTNSKRPVKTPADLKGLKIRTTPNPAHMQAFRLLGANPVPMPFTEVYLALKMGTTDGQENPLTLIEANKFYEAQKYLSLTRHAYTVNDVVMNLQKYEGLKPEYRTALHQAIHEAVVWQRKLDREIEGRGLAKMKAAGVQVEEKPDIDAFRQVVADAVAEEYIKKFGRETLDRIRATR